MKLRYRNHSQFGSIETTATAKLGLHRVQLMHREDQTDTIDLRSCAWVPCSRIWPFSFVALITVAGIIAVSYIAAGLWLHAVAPLAMVAVLLYKFPISVMRYGLLVSDHLVLVPETREEAHIFAGCRDLGIPGMLRKAWARR